MLKIREIIQNINIQRQCVPHPEATIAELLFDSRRLVMPARTIFFAIETEKNDGHRFIPELIQKGVRNFVVTHDLKEFTAYSECNFLQVADSVMALQQIAAAHRQRFSTPVVGITGSNGKTIVKEWLSQMLSEKFNLVASPNSYNSQIGVPCAVWSLKDIHQLAIFEAGISRPQEMERLETVIKPNIGILTNITSAHAQYFQNDEQKLNEKLLLFKNCGTIIYCCDNRLINNALLNDSFSHKLKLSWGKNPFAHYKITNQYVKDFQTFITLNENEFAIPFVDAASVENAIHCIVLMLHFNFSPKYINQRLALLAPIAMRMEVKEAINQSIVINDTYSLDFQSFRIALEFLHSQRHFSQKSVILSDFAQVGTLSTEDYQKINQYLLQYGVTKFIAVGENIFKHQAQFSVPTQLFFETTQKLIQALPNIDFNTEAILVKGARAFRFEKIVEALQLKTHRTVLNVSLPALVHNLNYYRSLISPQTKVVAMVKAQCYGLGDAELISELQYHNIDYLAVAYTDEGVKLRKNGITLPIIVLGAEVESFDMMLHYHLEPEIFNFYSLKELGKTLQSYPEMRCKIHLKIDTGMHRLGFHAEEIDEVIQIIKANPQMKVASVFSHFAAAEDETEDEFTLSQIAYFKNVTDKIQQLLGYPVLRHIANTAGISRFPQAHFDMVRVGIGLYGFSSVDKDVPHLQHVATLKTIITHTMMLNKGDTVGYNRRFIAESPMKIGIIPIGYADGFPTELCCGRGSVVVVGHHVPIIGKICMDMAMIDLSQVDANEGDEVIIYGEENRIDEIASQIGKIPYHLLTAISKRVPRIYIMD